MKITLLALAMIVATNWSEKVLLGPSISDPSRNSALSDASQSRSLSNCDLPSIQFNEPIVCSVGSLFRVGSPPAVARLIVPVDIDPINRVFGTWTRPHMSKECFEVVAPFSSNADASTAIVGVVGVFRIATSSNQVVPRAILCCVRSVHCVPVFQRAISCRFRREAPATLRRTRSTSELVTSHFDYFPAITATFPKVSYAPCSPIYTVTFTPKKPQNNEATDTCSSKICEPRSLRSPAVHHIFSPQSARLKNSTNGGRFV